MGIEDCVWSAAEVLNIVDGAELITIIRDMYLCVWIGGPEVEFYNITEPLQLPEIELLRYNAPHKLLTAHEAIEEFFIRLDADFESSCLTTPIWGVIIKRESDDTTEVD